LTKPRAKKKEMTKSQMTSLVKAEKAQEKDRVLVTTEAVRLRKAQAPTGRGLRTRPEMVEMKMESNCHALGETSRGLGTRNLTMRATEIEMRKGMGLTPSGGGGDGDGRGGVDGWEARFEAEGELRRWGEDRGGGERREIEERTFFILLK
jgi:hypothetical protein